MGWLVFVIIIAGLGVLAFKAILESSRREREKQKQQGASFRQKIDSISGFCRSHDLSAPVKYDDDYLLLLQRELYGGLYFDATNGKICVLPPKWSGNRSNESIDPEVYHCSQLQRVDVIDHAGGLITQSTPNNVLGRAVVGGILFGGTGAVVGALTSPTTSATYRTGGAKLALYFDDSDRPYHEIKFESLLDANTSYGKLWALMNEWQSQRIHSE